MTPTSDTSAEEKKNNSASMDASPPKDMQIRSTFHRYDSIFTMLVAPLVATRYFWLALQEINPFDFLNKGANRPHPEYNSAQKLGFIGKIQRNFAALGMGLTFLSVIGFYSKNTLEDIKSLYAEAVGYELGKKREDVTYGDLFMRSNNDALKVTRKAYLKRTLARLATAATFFIPWHKIGDKSYDANANAGIGAIGVYLFGEGFIREPSFFDIEQGLVMNAIHHTNLKSYEIIQPKNIYALINIQRRHLDTNYTWPDAGTAQGQNDFQVATRVADLMNQTYQTTPNTEGANLTLGKFNYLVGFGLLNRFPESLAYVELANKSADMKEVNNVAALIKKGQDPKAVFAAQGIDTEALLSAARTPTILADLPVETAHKKFADSLKTSDIKDIKPKTHADFATQTSGTTLGV
jgi:hypothetical protein